MLGFMITTSFLSLWISNTASTAMMLPVIEAVVQQLVKCENDIKEKNFLGSYTF
jgi:sodium-dependent dicarboxylate transporter 2/3/5